MKSVWAIVFLSLLLIEPSASLAIKGGDSSKDSGGSGSSGDKDSNETEGGSSGSMGKPEPMQIGAGFVLGMLLGGGGGSSSGAKGKDGGSSGSLPSSKGGDDKGDDGKGADAEEDDSEADNSFEEEPAPKPKHAKKTKRLNWKQCTEGLREISRSK